jgi:sialic acid synthase SpsE
MIRTLEQVLAPPESEASRGIEIAPHWRIGAGEPCFVIAEIGQNHNGSLPMACDLVDQVACAADAVKFCKRHIPSELTRAAFDRPYTGRNSFGKTYGEHRQRLELSLDDYGQLKRRAESHSLCFFATACDRTSVDDLEQIGVPLYKVASRDLTNLPLLDYIGQTGKAVILSCGMDSLAEIDEALATVRRHHDNVVLLQCTSAYPTAYEDVNLRAMAELRERFDVLVGLSDHTPGQVVALAAVALGAVVIEKHVTLDRTLPGTDHAASLTVAEFRRLAAEVRLVERALGDGVKRVPPAVRSTQEKLGRWLVAAEPIRHGSRLAESQLCLKSGGRGLKWRQRQRIVGRIARRDIPADELLQEIDFE